MRADCRGVFQRTRTPSRSSTRTPYEGPSRSSARRNRSGKKWLWTSMVIVLPEHVLGVLAEREDLVPGVGDDQVLLPPHRLLQPGMAGKGLDGEVHVLLQLRRILQGVGAGDPHPLVEAEPDAVAELLQGDAPVLVIVVDGEVLGHVRRGGPRPHGGDGCVQRVVALLVE